MFTVIYSFSVKPGLSVPFEEAWLELTKIIYEYEGSMGSRLHKIDEDNYMAYAQWPNKETWENFGDSLPVHAKSLSQKMKEACVQIKTTHQMQVVLDYLKDKPFG